MAPRKRIREEDDVEGDTEVEIESASSSFRQNLNNKRTKIALARERGGSVVSDDDDYQVDDYDDLLEDGDEERGPSVDPVADYSLHIDGEDDSDTDSRTHELMATQFVEKQMRELKDNIASEEGIIEQISARNFMCHSNLRIHLGPLINFIIGHNGSGKSAVLTALTMCLGGKASQSNRGANLKSMIKTGQETATLGVKIKNQGENAYKHETYGDSITVERHFSRSGTSGFKIKNDQNKTITTKRADLDDILDYFSLQLDNPINVLTQDLARSFLSNSTAAEKYKFFLKGTQLETLDADYGLFEIQLDNMNEKLRLREGDIELLAQKEKEAHQRKKRADRSQQLQQRIREVQRQHAWLQVQNEEETLEKYKKDVEMAEAEHQEKHAEAESVIAAFDAHDAAVQAAKRRFEEFQGQTAPAEAKRDAEKTKFDQNREELLKINAEERDLRDGLKKSKNEQKRLENEIALEKERLNGVHGDAHTRRLEELEELKETAAAAKQQLKDHNDSFPQLDTNVKDALKEHQNAKIAQQKAIEDVRTVNGRLQTLQRQEGPWHAPYHPQMRELVAAIDRETRWKVKPVGPMGTKVYLNKPEWGSIIEKTCGSALDSFAVTCKDDQMFLSQLATRCKIPHLPIIIGNPRPIDTIGNEPEEGVDTILRVLKIDDDLVRNSLIINQAIEQTVLIKDSAKARDYMHNKRPRNVKATIGFGGKPGTGVRYELSRTGAEKSGPVYAWQGQPRMRTNREEQLRHEQILLDNAKEVAEQAEQRTRRLANDLKLAQQAVEKHKRDQRSLKTKMQQDEDAAEAKQDEIDKNRPQDGKLQELERLLEVAKSDYNNAKEQFQDTAAEKQKLGDLGAELKGVLDTEQAAVDAALKRVEKAQEKLNEAEARRHNALLEKNEAIDNVEQAKDHIKRLEEKHDEKQEIVEDWTRQAEQISPRIRLEDGITIEVLDRRLADFKKQAKEAETRAGGSREEITAAYEAAHRQWQEAKKERDELVGVAKVSCMRNELYYIY